MHSKPVHAVSDKAVNGSAVSKEACGSVSRPDWRAAAAAVALPADLEVASQGSITTTDSVPG